ncbi:conserved hypothetical protein [Rhodococcus sp. RD6.2]|uniref:hypothetical protein n=1 Tax=Rhodococcus sp. RD6.2 TaxID=260936 RepID=UPI00063B5B48|nr:hypothetical protein [Rhodococcus sp. RD6.2]CRK49775.1 conserved hypothetical protein [Rhodococcus sp. RD6.2]
MDRLENEVPDVDRAEQADPVVPDDEQDDAAQVETVGTREVDEADAVEQSRAVPDDEDYPRS